MNILVQLVHPAHFHYYRFVVENLKKNGHIVIVAITSKDILEDLVKNANWNYVNVMPKSHKKNLLGYIYDIMIRNWRIFFLCKKHNINILTGSSVEISQIGWLLRKPAINIGEDDADVVPKFINAIAPFVELRVSPKSCNNGKIENKSIHFNGYLKLSYLHPNVFTPSADIVKSYGINTLKPFFLLRFSALNAHHDVGIKGLNDKIVANIIEKLKPHGDIYITSERKLDPQFEKYRIKINPLDIHHVMAFSQLFIGDSQTMAAESGILGVPFVRFNDFVGRIGYLRELEDDYKLGYGIKTNEENRLYQVIEELLNMPDRKEVFQHRRQKMLSEKIDFSKFFTWFLEKYPESKHIMQTNPDFQYNFK